VVERDDAAEGGDGARVGEAAAAEDAEAEFADADGADPGVGLAEERRDGPGVRGERAAVGAGEAARVLGPVVCVGLGLEAAEGAVQERVDGLLVGGEVVVERHRHGAEPGGDRAHRQRVEAVRRDGFGGVEDGRGGQ